MSNVTPEVDVSLADGVARLTLARPDRRNAITPAMASTMIEALETWNLDDEVRVVVIGAEGDHFCSGMDLGAVNRKPRRVEAGEAEDPVRSAGPDVPRRRPRPGRIGRQMTQGVNRLFETMWNLQLPTVSVVRGGAHGLGCGLALLSDFTVAADDASFSVPFVRRAFTPDSASSYLLPRIIGVARAKEMILRGQPIDADTAERWGLITRVATPTELDSVAEELIAELAAAATGAVGLAKWLLNRSLESSFGDAVRIEAFTEDLATSSADFKVGLSAFLSKQEARYTGR